MRGAAFAIALAGAVALRGASAAEAIPHNDYPTTARADYVFACMASNGQTREMLERCSCSIDTIASIVPYERYVEAETILSMQQTIGERSEMFREGVWVNKTIDELRRAQAEAEIRCF